MSQRPDADQTTAQARPFGVSLPILPDGPVLWRSLEERAAGGVPAERDDHDHGGPRAPWLEPPSRRDFFRFMAASLALGGVTGCAVQPAEQIVPYVEQPESIVPGKPLFFSTALAVDGYALGVLVESHMGRPTKIEGNPDHPASLGATDLFAQAAILDFYDPDRSQVVTKDGRVETWVHFQEMFLGLRERKVESKGAGLRILTRPVTSPTLADQFRRLREAFPQMKLHAYEPITRDAVRGGTKLAFGEELEPVYHLENADVIVALDADFFTWGPGRLKDARAFAARREVEPEVRQFITGRAEQGGQAHGAPGMNRLYVIEATPSITGGSADHRLPVAARDVEPIARAIVREARAGGLQGAELPAHLARHARWVEAVGRDLARTKGRCVVIPGESQPKEVHALAHLLNHALGNVGKTVEYLPRLDEGPADQFASLRELADDINAGRVDTLILLGVNPVYDAPADLKLAEMLDGGKTPKVPLKIHLGTHVDETARLCQWHLPEAHALEAWGDVRAFDGTATVQQPLIAPLYGGKSAVELLAILLGEPDRSGLEIVRDYWRRQSLPGDFEVAWRGALRKGVIGGTARKAKDVAPKTQDVPAPAKAGAGALEIVFRPDPSLWDGRFANNGWLQELPRPMNRLTWDNAAFISEALAKKLGITSEDVVELRYRGVSVQMPAWVQPGQAESSVTVFLGHGRREAGRVGSGVGVDVYPLRTSDAPWFGGGLEVVRIGRQERLAQTQHHFNMAGRDLVRFADLKTYEGNKEFAKLHKEDHWHATEGVPGREHAQAESLFENPEPQRRRQEGEGNAWGMAINLNTCIGCNACVVACHSENNIPVVGKEQVLASREMHWLRIDRYFEGSAEDPDIHFQPVMCQHCETAPCELVCPVAATTHSAEGLNEMTYNRCVGTRYCSNNCPYKVRRFNFFQYSDETTPSLKLMRNPDVTVRPRGVMEKCTYCVQRINEARIASEIRGEERVGGNEVQTACQAACPTRAIVFGNLNDREAHVVKHKASPRDYGLLADLNTRPRTTYLAKLRNPNPEIEKSSRDESTPRT